MKALQAAVVGVGYLGRFHAQKYAELDGVDLVSVVDIDADRARKTASQTGAEPFTSHRMLNGSVDLASVVVPTSDHFVVTRDLLEAGIHVLVEKPISVTVAEARHLVELATSAGRILQVGHLERFNPVMQRLVEHVDAPQFIESHRVSPFRRRGIDVSVVMDLMIHDIDLVLELVGAPVERVEASGASVLSSQVDIANARIQFSTGCIANVTASRASLKSERRMRLFQRNAYLSADLGNCTLDIRRRAGGQRNPGLLEIETERLALTSVDALASEIRAFVDSVRHGRAPLVSGIDGLRALETAVEVTRQMEANSRSARLRRRAPFASGARGL